jgi:hypothetical protein
MQTVNSPVRMRELLFHQISFKLHSSSAWRLGAFSNMAPKPRA